MAQLLPAVVAQGPVGLKVVPTKPLAGPVRGACGHFGQARKQHLPRHLPVPSPLLRQAPLHPQSPLGKIGVITP